MFLWWICSENVWNIMVSKCTQHWFQTKNRCLMVSLEPTHSVNFSINCEQTTFFGSKQRVCEPINLLWDPTGFLWDPDMYWSCFFDDSMQTCGTTMSAHVQKEIRNTQKSGKDNFALGSKVLRLSWPPNCSSTVQGTSDAHLTLWNDQSKTPMM